MCNFGADSRDQGFTHRQPGLPSCGPIIGRTAGVPKSIEPKSWETFRDV